MTPSDGFSLLNTCGHEEIFFSVTVGFLLAKRV